LHTENLTCREPKRVEHEMQSVPSYRIIEGKLKGLKYNVKWDVTVYSNTELSK